MKVEGAQEIERKKQYIEQYKVGSGLLLILSPNTRPDGYSLELERNVHHHHAHFLTARQ